MRRPGCFSWKPKVMAVPDYFARNAVAIAQAISGLDEERLGSILAGVRIGITLGHDSVRKEGQALTDLLVRLLSRLYPTLLFRSDSAGTVEQDARALAQRINPRVDSDGTPNIEVVVGSSTLKPWCPRQFFVGSTGWQASFSTTTMQTCTDTEIPFGPGVAACLAAANLFRHVFLPDSALDSDATFDVLQELGALGETLGTSKLSGNTVLAGCGAIGNATAWALSRIPLEGKLTIIDHQMLDLGNLQRYVLAERSDEGLSKPALAARYFAGPLKVVQYDKPLAAYLEEQDHRIDRLLLALDSASDRRAAQASLPRWVANAWTQPGDLGVSTHDFLHGACVCCLYLPERAAMNEDAIIAEAFGVPSRLMEIRLLLYRNEGAPRQLLEAIAVARDIPLDRLLPFEGRPLRSLYTEGFCGGAALPLSRMGTPRADVHVPLAHQSALAGVLLAAAALRGELRETHGSQVMQLDMLKPLPPNCCRPVAKDPRGICICQDSDYRDVYQTKYAEVRTTRQTKRKSRSRSK